MGYLNKTFNQLTILSVNDLLCTCKCSCGNIKTTKLKYVINNQTKSCGCLNNKKRAQRLKNKTNKNPSIASAKYLFKKRYSDGNLSFEQFLILSQQNCFYCDSQPSNSINCATKRSSQTFKQTGHFIYNGLDRIDSDIPHNYDNVVPCCKYCNYSKRERSIHQFYNWINNLNNNFIKKYKEIYDSKYSTNN